MRIDRNLVFALRESGVGGTFAVVPIATDGVGGEVGRKVRICDVGLLGSSKTY